MRVNVTWSIDVLMFGIEQNVLYLFFDWPDNLSYWWRGQLVLLVVRAPVKYPGIITSKMYINVLQVSIQWMYCKYIYNEWIAGIYTLNVSQESIQIIYTAGRPPWYDCSGHQEADAFVIGLCGGSASGKTSVAKEIIKASGRYSVGQRCISII